MEVWDDTTSYPLIVMIVAIAIKVKVMIKIIVNKR